jgi:hypothetical protein
MAVRFGWPVVIAAISGCLVLGACKRAEGSVQPSVPVEPEQPLIDHIEAKVRLPIGADPIANYDRYYAHDFKDGRPVVSVRYIDALFERDRVFSTTAGTPKPKGRARFVSLAELQRHEIDDGGCSAIHITYDVTRDRVTATNCRPDGPPVPITTPQG